MNPLTSTSSEVSSFVYPFHFMELNRVLADRITLMDFTSEKGRESSKTPVLYESILQFFLQSSINSTETHEFIHENNP